MTLELKKVPPVGLRSLGLDEKWLQDRIRDDPTLLGLGDLEIAAKEHNQPTGGRIDFLMRDAEAETYYEVEVMLGDLDESHIIRTLEYWDIERQRRPQFDHKAVIVAEHITSRFFNVLRLLNRAVPLIAVQLSAFRIDDGVGLHAVTVLDVAEETEFEDQEVPEQADRAYWEKRASSASIAIVDKIASSLRADGIDPKLTYNRYHIALSTSGYVFSWLSPAKKPGYCHIELRVGSETRDSLLAQLQEGEIDASPRRKELITFGITAATADKHATLIKDALKKAEEASRS